MLVAIHTPAQGLLNGQQAQVRTGCWADATDPLAVLAPAPCGHPQPGPEIEGVIAEPAPLTVINRTVLVFRATLLGETPTVRAQRAKKVIEDTLQETNDLEVRVDPILHSYLVLLGGRRAFIVTPLDAAADTITTGEAAEQAAENLRLVVEETRQARSLRFLLTAVGYSAAATLVFSCW